jgi:hypothetical protein
MFTLAIGLITVAAIVLSQLFYFHDAVQQKAKKETKTEQKSDKADDEAYFSVPSASSMPSSSHVEMQQDTFFLLETILDDEEDAEPTEEHSTFVNQFFQTLFGVLISPNAP